MIKLPEINLAHLERMTNSFGLIQHSALSKPDRGSGYMVDDNSRALIAMLKLNSLHPSKRCQQLAEKYSRFIDFAQTPNGWFHNHFSHGKEPLDRGGSPDSVGRAIWACGTALSTKNVPKRIAERCRLVFENSQSSIPKLKSLRSVSFALLGYSAFLKSFPKDRQAKKIAFKLSEKLLRSFAGESSRKWRWFEPFLTYSNPRLPQSLFEASRHLHRKEILKTAVSSFDFLCEKTILENQLVLIGQRGWYHKGSKRAFFDQQPVDAGAMVDAAVSAFKATREKRFLQTAKTSFEWFLGNNISQKKMYVPESGACFDGLAAESVNQNQGAESTLAYLLARIALEGAKPKLRLLAPNNCQ